LPERTGSKNIKKDKGVSLNSTELFAHLQQYNDVSVQSIAERSSQVGGTGGLLLLAGGLACVSVAAMRLLALAWCSKLGMPALKCWLVCTSADIYPAAS
jgi:hypothetical protein